MSSLSKVEKTIIIRTTETNQTANDDFDAKYGICDMATPRETCLCGRYKQSFAYYTLRQRLPNILNVLMDTLKNELIGAPYSEDDVSAVLASIEELKQQLESDAILNKFSGQEPDRDIWNNFIFNLSEEERSFFKTCWLYAECYLYRKIYSFFEASNTLRDFDYFGPQKINALNVSTDAMEELLQSTKTAEKNLEVFSRMLKLNLWGNRCDLSISSGKEIKPTNNLFELIDSLNSNILIDDSAQIWSCLNAAPPNPLQKVVDFICDNAGFELFTDLLMAHYLIKHNLADVIRFHVKAMPWFVSDSTAQDVRRTIIFLQEHTSVDLKSFGKQCSKYFEDGTFQVFGNEYFWTTAYEYYRMAEVDPALYTGLQTSLLIIFKGDLNYRKLLGDFNWDFTERFEKCLRGFSPSNLCALRTIKGDLMCGLQPGVSEQLTLQNSDWMFTGEYGVVQFTGKL